jgi:DNA repair protein RadD
MHLRDAFESEGVATAHIDGNTPKSERDEILEKLDSGAIQVVTNCDVLLEGWDCPSVSCAVIARPTKSYGLFLQMGGRIIRKADAKNDAIIIDHAGAVYRHGFIEDAGEWSLDPDTPIEERLALKTDQEREPVTCRECFSVYEAARSCPNCGWTPSPQARDVNMKEGRLREVKRKKVKKGARQAEWDNCLWRCIKTNKKIGVAAHMYKKKFGVFPQGLKMLPSGKAEWNMLAGDFYAYKREQEVRD